MLLQRKSLSFVVPSDVKYLSFMLLKVCKWTVLFYFTCQKLSKFSKTCFTTSARYYCSSAYRWRFTKLCLWYDM